MSDMNKWQDQWDKACKEKVFPEYISRLEKTNESLVDENNSVGSSKDIDSKYWKMIYEMSKKPTDSPDIMKHPLIDKSLGEKVKKVADSPNPVHPNTLGADNDVKVTQNWTDGDELRELVSLKNSLYELESKMNSLEGEGKDASKVIAQIKKIKTEIDNLSNEINNISSWKEGD